MPDWIADYADSYQDDDAEHDAPGPAPSIDPHSHVISCPHCQSNHIGPRSSESFNPRTQFRCKTCGKHWTETLPHGYERVYIAKRK